MKRMLAELADIQEVLLLYPRKRGTNHHHSQSILSKTSELQDSLLEILGVKPDCNRF